MARSSMWRTPQRLSTSICSWGSGEISSAKALRVNILTRVFVADSGWGPRQQSGGVLALAGLPEHIALLDVVDTGQHKEEIGKSIQVDDHLRIDKVLLRQGDHIAFRPSANSPSQVA